MSSYRTSNQRRRSQRCRVRARKLLPELVAKQDGKCHFCGRFIVVIRDIPEELRDEQVGPHIYFRSPEGELLFALYATTEHVIPLSKGGANTRDNLVAACHRCNNQRRPEGEKP